MKNSALISEISSRKQLSKQSLSQEEFEALAQSYGIDTSSELYSFYSDDIYQISQDVVNKGNID